MKISVILFQQNKNPSQNDNNEKDFTRYIIPNQLNAGLSPDVHPLCTDIISC